MLRMFIWQTHPYWFRAALRCDLLGRDTSAAQSDLQRMNELVRLAAAVASDAQLEISADATVPHWDLRRGRD